MQEFGAPNDVLIRIQRQAGEEAEQMHLQVAAYAKKLGIETILTLNRLMYGTRYTNSEEKKHVPNNPINN